LKIGFTIKLATYITTSGNYPEFTGKSLDVNGEIIE